MEMKGVTCKIPLELHNQISEEIRASGSTMGKFIEMVITSYYEDKEKGDQNMGKMRTMAFQVSEELFQKIKEYLAEYERVYGRRLTQKEFVIGLVEQALEEAREEFDAARAALGRTEQSEETDEDAGEYGEDEDDLEEPEYDGAEDADEEDGAEQPDSDEEDETDEDGLDPEDEDADDPTEDYAAEDAETEE